MSKPLVIRDPIHGDMVFESPIKEVIDYPEFQRLKQIKQNGLLHLVYPSMKHSRFEHSLGAAHLAKKWFEALLYNTRSHGMRKFPSADRQDLGDNKFLRLKDSKDFYAYMDAEKDRYKGIIMLSALFHDLGHGPLSHTLEKLGLLSLGNISADGHITNQFLLRYFSQKNSKVEHEDFSLFYLNKIFNRAAGENIEFFSDENNLLIIAALLHKEFKDFLLKDQSGLLSNMESKAVKILSVCISSLFDVDRMDYLNRDSYMAGVLYGRVDTDRLVHSLLPVFIEKHKDLKVGFLAKARFVHALDHCLVSLYTLYTQLYLHPTNMIFEQVLKEIVFELKKGSQLPTFTYDVHCESSDEKFLRDINESSGGLLEKLLNRQLKRGEKIVYQLYPDSPGLKNSKLQTWPEVESKGREIIKDPIDIWLFDFDSSVFHWEKVSLVANKLKDAKYIPKVFWNKNHFESELQELRDYLASVNVSKAVGEEP